ncbi:MAG: hypothetical protein LBF71_01200 [Campylobacteraceae bacterium]|jgi:hypothetical protein|nr:hypothetical protein [Campylobacteraceae bacterium]
MANKKRRLTPKNENISLKELKNTPKSAEHGQRLHNKEVSSQELEMQTVVFCAAVMLCSIGVIVYIVFL